MGFGGKLGCCPWSGRWASFIPRISEALSRPSASPSLASLEAPLNIRGSSALLLARSLGGPLSRPSLKRSLGFGPRFFGRVGKPSGLGRRGVGGRRCSRGGSSGRTRTLSPRLTVLGGKMVGTTARRPSRALGVTVSSGLG
ncbi:hypothetical protein AALO_G00104730 [Alosa alosa]|uniref:Uncharacterized protein n=1 Tax=Alosa alosa TaxID=278164 RepID=A0AAV6GYU8_9TELE|nr:hypothetical protein AALO_G00104730 [Alosa alosa]